MPAEKIVLGQLAKSNAGRDRGHLYLIVGVVSPTLVLLANGKDRKLNKPKKKNIRHISVLNIVKDIAAEFASGLTVTDEKVRLAIDAYLLPDNSEMRARGETHVQTRRN
jgi:ribosomal protein L14E/L6E/L27E